MSSKVPSPTEDIENLAVAVGKEEDDTIRISCIADSPKLTTGFGNVARMIYKGFHEAGFKISAFGMMDDIPDYGRKLPYFFWGCNTNDKLGHDTIDKFLEVTRPDIIFMLTDPGNLEKIVSAILNNKFLQHTGRVPKIKPCPIIAYIPIEGFPVPDFVGRAIGKIESTGGRAVLYTPGMVDLVDKHFDGIKPEFAYHGVDHADFRPYDAKYKKHLRELIELDDYFIVGSVGVNKRTKGFDTLIATARCLRDMGKDKGIKFYLHTSPNRPTMQGYHLDEMAFKFGVRDMILFKPESELEEGGNIRGIGRESKVDFAKLTPSNYKEQTKIYFSQMSYIDRMNILDMYVDVSQVEGWGLPLCEAMKCGVPSVSIDDLSVRKELWSELDLIETMSPRLWTTWQTDVKLALVDPKLVANKILEYKNDPEKREWSKQKSIELASNYNWQDTQEKFVELVYEVHRKYYGT